MWGNWCCQILFDNFICVCNEFWSFHPLCPNSSLPSCYWIISSSEHISFLFSWVLLFIGFYWVCLGLLERTCGRSCLQGLLWPINGQTTKENDRLSVSINCQQFLEKECTCMSPSSVHGKEPKVLQRVGLLEATPASCCEHESNGHDMPSEVASPAFLTCIFLPTLPWGSLSLREWDRCPCTGLNTQQSFTLETLMNSESL